MISKVVDRSGAKEGEFSDLSKVEKFTISDDAYAKKSGTLCVYFECMYQRVVIYPHDATIHVFFYHNAYKL